jgi:hypothetical protein
MKTNNIIIRPFRIGDYEKVAALWEEAGHYRPKDGKTARGWRRK